MEERVFVVILEKRVKVLNATCESTPAPLLFTLNLLAKKTPTRVGGGKFKNSKIRNSKFEIRNPLQESLDFLLDLLLVSGLEAEVVVHDLAVTVDEEG